MVTPHTTSQTLATMVDIDAQLIVQVGQSKKNNRHGIHNEQKEKRFRSEGNLHSEAETEESGNHSEHTLPDYGAGDHNLENF